MTNEMNTATNPIKNEILAPTKTLLKRSLPYLSVPKRKVFSEIKNVISSLFLFFNSIVLVTPSNPSEAYSEYV